MFSPGPSIRVRPKFVTAGLPKFVTSGLMRSDVKFHETKVPEVTLGFWVIKILATTLGETGGDTVTMTWLKADVMVNAGYLVGSAIFLSALIVLVVIQIVAKKFHPFSSGPPSWPPRQPVRRWP